MSGISASFGVYKVVRPHPGVTSVKIGQRRGGSRQKLGVGAGAGFGAESSLWRRKVFKFLNMKFHGIFEPFLNTFLTNN